MRFLVSMIIASVLLLAVGCSKKPAPEAAQRSTAPAAKATPETAKIEPSELPGEFQTPESVLYDPAQDVYFVSNINGAPLAKDGNGYISRIDAATLKGTAKWIAGGVNGVTLNAPKGSAVVGNTLWVTDIDTVRKFNAQTGAPEGDIPIPGSTFLNDLAAGPDGTVYVTDTGMKAGEKGFEPAGTDAVYEIGADGKPVKIASGDLGHPNGVLVVDGNVWVNTFGTNELYRLSNRKKGEKTDVVKLPTGSLDGLLHLANGDFLVSSWAGKAVYEGPAGGPFKAIVENTVSPADIGLDTKRNLLLIPSFEENKVLIHPLATGSGSYPMKEKEGDSSRGK